MHNLYFLKKYYLVNRADIAYLRFIIESYDGLATLSTEDAAKGIISLSVPSCFIGEADRLVQALKDELTIAEIPCPGETPELADDPGQQERNGNA